MKAARLILIIMVLSNIYIGGASAELEGGEDSAIADAIFKAEGGYGATYLYGIRSIPYVDEADARQICMNTIRNQRRRHAAHVCGFSYLECLARRYCPVGCDNDNGTNKYWLRNVKYFLGNEK